MADYALDDEGLAHYTRKLKQYVDGKVGVTPDEEDTTSVDGKLKLRDRTAADGGRPYIILRNGKTLASQMTVSNAIYEVRYTFDLGGETLTLPKGSLLRFAGGMFRNGRLSGVVNIEAGDVQIFDAVTFDLASCNFTLNVRWLGAKGDYSRGSTTYTDDTAAIQAAIDTEMSLYFPAGKYAVRNVKILSYTEYFDSSTKTRSKGFIGEDFHTTWLVGIDQNGSDVVSFYGCFSDFKNVYVTTANDCHYQNGVHFVKFLPNQADQRPETELLINCSTLDIVSYGDFDVCVNIQESIQYSFINILSTHIPECMLPEDVKPKKGLVYNCWYNYGGNFDIRVEFATVCGIEFTVESAIQARVRFLDEGEMRAGFFRLPCLYNNVEIYHSYTECFLWNADHTERIPERIEFRECQNVTINRSSLDYFLTDCQDIRIVKTDVPHGSCSGNKRIIFEDCASWFENYGTNSLDVFLSGSLRRGHGTARTALINESPKCNLASNRYRKNQEGITVVGEGYDDETHHSSFNHSVFVSAKAWAADFDIVDFEPAYKYGLWTISAFVKLKEGTDVGRVLVMTDVGGASCNSGVRFHEYAIPIGDGWYFFKMSQADWQLSAVPTSFKGGKFSFAISTADNDDAHAEYYMTKVALVPGGGVNYPWIPYLYDTENMNGGSSSNKEDSPVPVVFNRLPNNYTKYTSNQGQSIVGKGLEEDVRTTGFDYSMKVTSEVWEISTRISGMSENIERGFVFSAVIKKVSDIGRILLRIKSIGTEETAQTYINRQYYWNGYTSVESYYPPLPKQDLGDGWYRITLVVTKDSLSGFTHTYDKEFDFGLVVSADNTGTNRASYYITQMALNGGESPLIPWVPMVGEEPIELTFAKERIAQLERDYTALELRVGSIDERLKDVESKQN